MGITKTLFWASGGLLAYTHVGYPLTLAAVAPLRKRRSATSDADPGRVGDRRRLRRTGRDRARVANLRALDYPPARLRGRSSPATDRPTQTAANARGAGADVVLELPRGGKIRAQDAGVERARGEIVAFSDANVRWEPDALRRARSAVRRPRGRLRMWATCGSSTTRGTNQEGVYWRYEMAVRALESRLRSVTGGNGAIYATRRDVVPRRRPDHGPRPVVPVQHGQARLAARSTRPAPDASEKMVPTIEGEFARKRRMMSHGWPIVAARRACCRRAAMTPSMR